MCNFRWPLERAVHAHILPPIQSDDFKRRGGKITDGMRFSGRNDIVVRCLLLQHLPHHLDIFGRVAPIPLSVEVSKMKDTALAGPDCGNSARDLPGNELRSTQWRFVIEENAAASVHAVRLAVVYRAVVREHF